MKMPDKYYPEIDILKGFAILLVLLGHSIRNNYIDLTGTSLWCEMVSSTIYSFHMALFFIISGFLFGNREIKYKELISKKFKRLLIPYLLLSSCTFIFRALLPQFVNKHVDVSISEYFNTIILNGGHYWFVYCLLIIFLVFPLIQRASQKISYGHFMLFLILTMLAVFPVDLDLFELKKISENLIYFFIGCLLKKHYQGFRNNFSGNHMLLILFPCFFFFKSIGTSSIYVEHIIKIILAVTGSWISYVFILKINNMAIKKLLTICGLYSLQLYLLELYPIAVNRVIAFKFLDISSPIFIVPIVFLADTAVIVLLCRFLFEKNRTLKMMLGIN